MFLQIQQLIIIKEIKEFYFVILKLINLMGFKLQAIILKQNKGS